MRDWLYAGWENIKFAARKVFGNWVEAVRLDPIEHAITGALFTLFGIVAAYLK